MADFEKMLDSLAERYDNSDEWKILLNSVSFPFLVDPFAFIDTALTTRANKIQQRRAVHFLSELGKILGRMPLSLTESNEEEVFDILRLGIEHSVKTRVSNQRALYASIASQYFARDTSAEDTELAMQMVASLSLLQLKIIHIIDNSAQSSEKRDEDYPRGKRAYLMERHVFKQYNPNEELVLGRDIPDVPLALLRHALSNLISQGILGDLGESLWGGSSMTLFVTTDTFEWLLVWLKRPVAEENH